MLSPGLDDSELLRRARVDANAFAASYRRHARAVYGSLLSDGGDPDVPLDLTAAPGAVRIGGTDSTPPTLLPRLPGLAPVENTAA